MLEHPEVSADTASLALDRAALVVENSELRARIESREQRIRLLEEALRLLKANTYGPSRERLSVAAGQAKLFNEIEVTLDMTESVDIEPELKATPVREEKPSAGKPGRARLAAHLPRVASALIPIAALAANAASAPMSAELPVDLNRRPFKKLPGCRASVFEAIDLDATARHALRVRRVVQGEGQRRLSRRGGPVLLQRASCAGWSIPHGALQRHRRRVCFHKGERVAVHVRSHQRGKFTTLAEHMPRSHQKNAANGRRDGS